MKPRLTKSELERLRNLRYRVWDYYGDFLPLAVTVSGYWIELMYYPYWKEAMEKVGKSDLISLANCIDDWVVCNWAQEL